MIVMISEPDVAQGLGELKIMEQSLASATRVAVTNLQTQQARDPSERCSGRSCYVSFNSSVLSLLLNRSNRELGNFIAVP